MNKINEMLKNSIKTIQYLTSKNYSESDLSYMYEDFLSNQLDDVRYINKSYIKKDKYLDIYKSIFKLAGIEVNEWIAIPNKYWTEHCSSYDKLRYYWYLAQTKYGLIEIGWRKSVMKIDWSRTNIEIIITEDDVTKTKIFVHAWNNIKAIEYLKQLKIELEKGQNK